MKRSIARSSLGDLDALTRVALFVDSVPVVEFGLGDRLRADSRSAVQKLRDLKYQVAILSGDSHRSVQGIARDLEVPVRIYSEVSPEEKGKLIQLNPVSIVVGDGANDVIALASASIGIAVHGGMEISFKAADVFNTTPRINAGDSTY